MTIQTLEFAVEYLRAIEERQNPTPTGSSLARMTRPRRNRFPYRPPPLDVLVKQFEEKLNKPALLRPQRASIEHAQVSDRYVRRDDSRNRNGSGTQWHDYQRVLRAASGLRTLPWSCANPSRPWMGRMVSGDHSKVRPPWLSSNQPQHLLSVRPRCPRGHCR